MNLRNRKQWLCALAALLTLACGGQALADISFDGKVVSSDTLSILAPFGGIIDTIHLRKGNTIHIGDPVATIQTTKVYAPMDGVVSGIFAREGDDTAGIVSRYGGVLYLEPNSRYMVSATTEKAYNSSATRYVHIGEEVYLSCTKDGTHVGTAVVTSVDDLDDNGNTPYRLEVTSGSFYMGETVGIYRTRNHTSSSRIGRGTVHQNVAQAITGATSGSTSSQSGNSGGSSGSNNSSSVLRIHVREGDEVERGQLLFETVEGALDGLYAMDNTIVSGLEGIVASVEVTQGSSVAKNGKLMTVYPKDAMQIEMYVSEMDLPEIHEGDPVSIEFEWDVDATMALRGTISEISRVGTASAEGGNASNTGETRYSVFVDFDPVEAVSMDMSVVVHLLENGADEDEAKS